MKIYRAVCAIIILLIGTGVMAYSGARIFEAEQIYQEGDSVYENLRSHVMKNKVSCRNSEIYENSEEKLGVCTESEINSCESDESDEFDELNPINNIKKNEVSYEASEEEPQIYIPDVEINYDGLNSINNDAAAWLYCPGTAIDYPVMKTNDYNYYLTHLPDGTENANGSLFIDYNCASDFSGKLTVIYGHHMRSGSMFGSLKRYKEQAYYEKHPFMYLYTEQGNYRIELIYSCVVSAGQWGERGFMYSENAGELLAYAAHNTTFESGRKYKESDRIVVLSTCSYEFDDARFVVIGILKEEY